MALEPDYTGGFDQAELNDQASNEPTDEFVAGTFVGRQAEQARFREMLREMAGPRKGFFSSLMGGTPRKTKTSKTSPVKSRVVLISGQAGSGKTRLSLRLREIVQKEKEFTHRFRTVRFDLADIFQRDTRLSARLDGENLSPEVVLDLLHNHILRENGEGYFEDYRAALVETAELARTVQGAELQAVWDYRARAFGQSLKVWSNDRPIILILDDISLITTNLISLLKTILEESGSQILVIMAGEFVPPGLAEVIMPERFAAFETGPLSEEELKSLVEIELLRYRTGHRPGAGQPGQTLLFPGLLEDILQITGGQPLACRVASFLLQTGLSASDLTANPGEGQPEILTRLAEKFIAGPLGPGHPDRLKLYALAVLRRPEPGLLAALFDLRKDMLEIDETLGRFNQRYAFLFEPGRPMNLHRALLPAFRHWLVQPDRRSDQGGLVKVNQHGLEYLDTRLQEWGANFGSLSDRLNDLKWREWALDKTWHSFWISEELGWPVALSMLVAGLGLRPLFARQVTALLEQVDKAGLLDERGQQRLALFRKSVVLPPEETQPILDEYRMLGREGNFFINGLPQFAPELSNIIEGLLS